MPADRWFGVGSCAGDQERAGARAVDDALIHDDPKLLIVFCSQAQDLRQLLRQISERASEVPLIGCTTAGEIATAGLSDGSVVVAVLGGSGFAVRTAERSLSCIAEVPQGALVWVMEGHAQSVLEATDAARGDSLAALGGRPPPGLIAFDGIARRAVLGERASGARSAGLP
jgi:small ligand-binding sensory domain FIST